MTDAQARRIIDDFERKNVHNEDEEFMFIEACEYLIDKTHDPRLMMHLGGYYYELRNFDLALKYYEMASALHYDDADECLGYIWYYGRTGQKDYEKAFRHFKAAADRGNIVARYKIADMYKNGYYVEKDYDEYKRIIRELYPEITGATNVFAPLPEIYTRLAHIEAGEGNEDEACELYLYAKDFLAQRIRYNAFFGNLNIMKWLIQDLYKLMEPDRDNIDLYDLYYYLEKPVKISFKYMDRTYHVECMNEDGENVIRFEDKWFRSADDFFRKATIGSKLLTDIYRRLSDFEIE